MYRKSAMQAAIMRAMLNTVIRAMGEMLQVRGGPQNLPTSWPLLAAGSVALIGCSTLIFRLQGVQGTQPVLQALVSYAVLLASVQTALRVRNFANRLPQTMTALVLAGCFFSLVAWWPISVLAPHLPQMREGSGTTAPLGPTLLMLVLGIWSLVVQSHVLRVAMEIRMLAAFGLVLLYEMLSVLVVSVLFGQAAAPVS